MKDINIHHAPENSSKPQWLKVDDGFIGIYAGFSGVVCGIKNSALHFRRGITHTNPMGTEWLDYMCDVTKVMIGTRCIVRESSKRTLHSATINIYSPAELLDWKFVPHPDNTSSLCCTVADNDRLYTVVGPGEIFCYELLTGDPQWKLVMGPPPVMASSSGLLTELWRSIWNVSREQERFSIISAGMHSIWCLKDDRNDIWQLVVSQLNAEIKLNWMKSTVALNDQEKIISFSSSRSNINVVHLICKEKECYKLVSCSINANKRVESSLPVNHPCTSIAISSTENSVVKEEHVCCEDGTCFFCVGVVESSFHHNINLRKRTNVDYNHVPAQKKSREDDTDSDYNASLLDGIKFSHNKHLLINKV